MVKVTRIYTRSGDKGLSSLGDGTRRKKADVRFETIGNIDEVNAYLGLLNIDLPSNLQKLVKIIQGNLCDLGADLAVPRGKDSRINPSQVEFLETQIALFSEDLQPLEAFVLPGGSKTSAMMHVVRAIARRAERNLVLLNEYESINAYSIQYLNRLSDLLFVWCRHLNNNGKDDVLWKSGTN